MQEISLSEVGSTSTQDRSHKVPRKLILVIVAYIVSGCLNTIMIRTLQINFLGERCATPNARSVRGLALLGVVRVGLRAELRDAHDSDHDHGRVSLLRLLPGCAPLQKNQELHDI